MNKSSLPVLLKGVQAPIIMAVRIALPATMSPKYLASDKEMLLPVTTAPSPPPTAPQEEENSKVESVLFYLCASTLLVLFGSLYFKDSLPPLSPLASALQLLHVGMLSSLWASLPAPALLFIFAPYFAEQSKVTVVRYWIYLFYIIGVAVGAVVFGGEASAMECAMP